MGAVNERSPSDVMLEATRATLRAGRFPPGEVIRRQLEALADAGYRLEPQLEDSGAALMLAAARRAIRTAHFAPGAVIARQLDAVGAAGHAFVRRGEDSYIRLADGRRTPCPTFQWGPDSFEACARCGRSYWHHAEGAIRARGAHRRENARHVPRVARGMLGP